MERKRLRVDGIPTDIPAGRAKDKLTIHFLRSRNGGGDVESVEVIQGSPAYAIVTFEDDEVVESVLKIKDHTLRINDKIYNLVVSEVAGKAELEEVFQKLSLTVNYRKFPESCRSLLKNLMHTHTDVKFDFDKKSMTCTISGSYAEVQTLAQEILGNLDIEYTNPKKTSSDTRRKTKGERLKNHSDPQDIVQVLDQQTAPLYGSAVDETYKTTESLEQLQEPFVWDSDIFKYIQKYHSVEYQEILNVYHVQAVDESSDGITTIYLETVGRGKAHSTDLLYARSRLMGLYQDLEVLLRKEQIDKKDVSADQDFYRTLSSDLQRLYPSLLCHEDNQYLYLIGNGVDVAHGKQYISDLHMKFDRMLSYPDIQLGSSGASSVTERASLSLSPTYKHESKVGSRIAASFNSPTAHSSYSTRSHIDEKYLVSNSPSRQLLERDPPSDKKFFTSTITSDLLKNEDFSISQPDEKLGSKTMPSLKRRDVFPALKTGREDIRHRVATKPTGPLKPVLFTKASSELPYSSLVDINPPSMDFKIPEGKLRRSNSLSRVYSKESTSSEQQSDTAIYKDEIIVTDWLWHYIKQFYKSDIDSWCSQVVLTEEEKQNGDVTVKLKATDKAKLTLPKEKIQLLCWKEDSNITSSPIDYAALGVQGPDDSALVDWCDLFWKCSRKVSVKLEKDKLVLIYPKEIREDVLEEYNRHLDRKMKSPRDDVTPDNGPSSLHLKDKLELAEDYITKYKQSLEADLLSKPSSFYLGSEDTSQTSSYRTTRDLADQKLDSPVGGTDPFRGITHEHKAYFDDPVPALRDEKSPEPKELQDFFEDTKNRSTLEKTDSYASRKDVDDVSTEAKTYDHGSYTSEVLSQDINLSPPNVQSGLEPHYGEHDIATEGHTSLSQLRIPAVGQESETMDSICDQCRNSGKIVQTSSGHLCVKCYATSIISALNNAAKGTLRATMNHTPMSLRLSGYERDTTLKIIYEVPDGVQGAGDPQPGSLYKGGKFEAYLPDNREGRKLLALLQKALDQGLIFHIKTFDTGEKVTWHKIPHKTSPDGGKQKNGYPDLAYMKSTIAILKQNGIE
ncbi:uncharacterized protein [Dendropsophus ebraccatus]|uniref:uncharacterized protein n=1 Tax=Dendropsophus ebraccatus TaxID=150705 RepID=UPI00383159E0